MFEKFYLVAENIYNRIFTKEDVQEGRNKFIHKILLWKFGMIINNWFRLQELTQSRIFLVKEARSYVNPLMKQSVETHNMRYTDPKER